MLDFFSKFCGGRKRARPSSPAAAASRALVLELDEIRDRGAQAEKRARQASEKAQAKALAALEKRVAAMEAEVASALAASASAVAASASAVAASASAVAALERRSEVHFERLRQLACDATAAERASDAPFAWCQRVATMGGAFTLEEGRMRATLHHDSYYQPLCADRPLACGREVSQGRVTVSLDFGDSTYYNILGFADAEAYAKLRRGERPWSTMQIPGTCGLSKGAVELVVDTELRQCSVDGKVVLRDLPTSAYLVVSSKMDGAVITLGFP